MFAAIAGAVISSLASMLNSAATIFTMDIYTKYINTGAFPKWRVDSSLPRFNTSIKMAVAFLLATATPFLLLFSYFLIYIASPDIGTRTLATKIVIIAELM